MIYNAIHVVARGVILSQDHILLCGTVDRTPNFYFLPGGHVEPKESAEQAVVRELLEESGFTFTIKRFLGCLEYIFEPEGEHVCHNHEYNMVFEAVSPEVNSDIVIPKIEEHIELQWVPLSRIDSIDFRPAPLKQLIIQWLNDNVNQPFHSKVE